MGKSAIRVVLFLVFLSGMLYCTEERFQFFRLRSVSFDSLALVSDDQLWKRVEPKAHRFWPFFSLKLGSIERSIMAEAPVDIDISRTGPGVFKVKAKPLEPWFMVFWAGGEWFLAREGRMWSVHHSMNSIISQQSAREGAVLVWGRGLPDPVPSGIDIENSVKDSLIPCDEIESWKEALDNLGFYKKVSSITINRSEGRRTVEILERTSEGSVRILLDEFPAHWPPLLEAVNDILSQTGLKDKNLLVDTTYSGKILVRVIS